MSDSARCFGYRTWHNLNVLTENVRFIKGERHFANQNTYMIFSVDGHLSN